MAGEYITTGLITDPDELLVSMIADYQERVPGWAASESDPLYINLAIQSYRHAVLLDVATQVLDTIFRYEGASIFGVPANDALPATADATFTVRNDNLGPYVIPAGLRVDVYGPDPQRFTVQSEVTVPIGASTTAVGGVRLVAEQAGPEGSGLSGPIVLVDPVDYILTATLVGVTAGGRAGETNPEYMDRLARRAQRLSPKYVTIPDLAEGILDITGVGATLVKDNYVPAGPGGTPAAQTGVAGAATVFVRTAEGAAVPSDVRAAILADIADSRLDDVLIYLADPTPTTVDVTWTATAFVNALPATVRVAGDAALAAYLASGRWGLVGTAGLQVWREALLVRYGELYAVLNAVDGLDTVDSINIGGAGLNTNFAIAGPAGVTVPGVMTGTVIAGS